MNISTKSLYGLRAVILLAKENRVWSIKEIGEKEDISSDYLEKIFARLKKAGIVKAKRGSRGGYILARNPRDINMAQIVNSLEDDSSLVFCIGERKINCPMEKKCIAKNAWEKIQNSLDSALKSVSLYEVINE